MVFVVVMEGAVKSPPYIMMERYNTCIHVSFPDIPAIMYGHICPVISNVPNYLFPCTEVRLIAFSLPRQSGVNPVVKELIIRPPVRSLTGPRLTEERRSTVTTP